MYQIQDLTANAKQEGTLVLPDGGLITFSIFFASQQFGWFFRSIKYNDFEINGLRICTSYNLLHQFRNQIPFGLACITEENREPYLQNDFKDGVSRLFILDAEEVELYSGVLSGEVQS